MKLIILHFIASFCFAISSSHAQVDLNQITELVNLFNQFKSNITHIIGDEKFQDNFKNSLNTLISSISKQDHKELIDSIIPQLLSVNSTQQVQQVLRPLFDSLNIQNFDLGSLVEQTKNIVPDLLVYANKLFGAHETSYYIEKLEASLRRIITQLLANKDVQNALKQVLTSAEKVFGKIDIMNLFQQVQNGYGQALNDPKVQETIQNAMNQFKQIFFD